MKKQKCSYCKVGDVTKKNPKYCSLKCYWEWKRETPRVAPYKGRTYSMGYVYLYMPNHPNAISKGRYIAEHRHVMEQKIGRYLERDEVVHHINGIKTDNRPENLQLLTNLEHSKQHGREKSIPVQQISMSGDLVAKYESVKGASKLTGIRHSSIYLCVTGKYKKAGGFVWKKL